MKEFRVLTERFDRDLPKFISDFTKNKEIIRFEKINVVTEHYYYIIDKVHYITKYNQDYKRYMTEAIIKCL